MTGPRPGGCLVDGVRLFYEEFRAQMRVGGGIEWPPFDDLTSEQNRAWLLAQAAAIESSVRYAEAAMSMGES